MPKILNSPSGYYFVDSWDNVLTYRHVMSHEEIDMYQGKGIATFVSLVNRIRRNKDKVPDGFDVLGIEDDFEDELGVHQTARWARNGFYRWVPK